MLTECYSLHEIRIHLTLRKTTTIRFSKLASDPENVDLVKRHNEIESDLELQRQKSVREYNEELIINEKIANPEKRNDAIAKSKSSEIKTNIAPEGMTPAQFREAKDFLKRELDELGLGDAKVVSTGSRQTGITTNPKKPNFGHPNPDLKRDLDMRKITDGKITKSQLDKIAKEFKSKFGIELGIKQTPLEQWQTIPKFGVVDVL